MLALNVPGDHAAVTIIDWFEHRMDVFCLGPELSDK